MGLREMNSTIRSEQFFVGGCWGAWCGDSPVGENNDNTHGSLNVPNEHHPTIRYMVYNGYYKVMSNIPKMGQLPTPDTYWWFQTWLLFSISYMGCHPSH